MGFLRHDPSLRRFGVSGYPHPKPGLADHPDPSLGRLPSSGLPSGLRILSLGFRGLIWFRV